MRSNSPRCSTSNAYQQDYIGEHNVQYPEERSSVESVVETEEPGINKNNVWLNGVYFSIATYA